MAAYRRVYGRLTAEDRDQIQNNTLDSSTGQILLLPLSQQKENRNIELTSTYAGALSAGRAGGNQSLGGLLRFSVTNQCRDGHPGPHTHQ